MLSLLSHLQRHAQKPDHLRLIHHRDLLFKTGLLPISFPIILVGGTNGKGSTSTCLASILQAAQLKVGLNTSPHMVHYRERIRIQGEPIHDLELARIIATLDALFADFPLSFAEYSFLAALYAFKTQKVDIAVFEIGLGGRLDPANTLNPIISIVTNISLDHMELLGDTREKIAFEKAGILRPYLPVILGENPPCEPLLQEAQHLNAPDYIHGVDFSAQEISPTTWRFKHQNVDLTLPIPKIWLNNASCAVMASILLREHFLISDEAIATGLQNTFILGRFQQVPWLCRLILDAAHNPAGATLLSKQLAALEPVSGRRYAIFAAKANKNIAEMIQTLRPHVDEWIVVDEIGLASKESLKTDYLPEASLFPTAYSALKSLSNRVTDSDSILVFGSCYLVGSALSALEHIYSGPFLSRRSN